MKNNYFAVFILVAAMLILVLSPALAFGKAEAKGKKKTSPGANSLSSPWARAEAGEIILVAGTVRLVGNEPLTALVLTDADGKDWYLDEEGKKLLMPFLQKPALVRGKVALKEMILANGTILESRRILTEVEIVR